MESGKGTEAGPSTAKAGVGAGVGVGGDEQQEMKKEMTEVAPSRDGGGHFDDGDEEEEGEEEDEGVPVSGFVPGPLVSLKEQIEKDKEDDSLRRWKEQLLGCVESDLNGQMDPEVKFHSMGILSDDFGEKIIPLPVDQNRDSLVLFTLREGSKYQLKLTFSVLHNIVSGLTYSNTVWKGGIQVDQSKGMLGTFAPQRDPYMHTLEEETTPSGVLARGIYSANIKFEDDDRRCHMELKYSFEIKRNS